MRGRWASTADENSYRFFRPEQVDKILCDGAKRGRALMPQSKEFSSWSRKSNERNSGNEYASSNTPRAGHVTAGSSGAPTTIRSSLADMKKVGQESKRQFARY